MAHNLIIHSDGFLDQNWRGSLQSSSITGATHWYRCSVGIRCPKKIQLRINTITDVRKRHKIIQVYAGSNIYCTSDCTQMITRIQCRDFLKYIENIDKEINFDDLIVKSTEIKVIHLNQNEWENSQCSCKYWHKELKCRHIIALACRLQLASYIEVAYNAPLTTK